MGDSLDDGHEPRTPLDTERILADARAGDRAAFEDLYVRIAPTLLVWAQLRLHAHPARALEADDVVQEVWLRALKNFGTFDAARGSFRIWILGIAKHVLLESFRKNLRTHGSEAPPRGDDESGIRLAEIPASVTSLRSRFARDETMQQLLRFVGELDDDDRRLLMFCAFEEYTCVEAATRLALPVETVSKRWQRLRKRLEQSGAIKRLDLLLSE